LQIWLLPVERGGEPRYAEKPLGDAAKPNALTLLFSGDGHHESIAIRQDSNIYFGKLDKGGSLPIALSQNRHVWLHVIKGGLQLPGESFGEGDSGGITNPSQLEMTAAANAEFLLFDLN
jgi:redox-sensitive bicupin YhaK (pirin superfamily)